MVEEPNFEYKYDLALWKSFSARLSFAILTIAAAVFLVAILGYLYIQQEQVKEETAQKAKTQLHDAVMSMRLKAAETLPDTVPTEIFIDILQKVQPYSSSFTMMTDEDGHLLFISDDVALEKIPHEERLRILDIVCSGETGMQEVFKGANLSLLIYEPVVGSHIQVAVVCSRIDILSGYQSLILYGVVAFVLGLLILFSACSYAIYKLVNPLQQFTKAAMSIADGNLDTPLPEIHSKDELLLLRNSFEHMQTSLKQHIADLKITTAGNERLQSELKIAHDIQMGMIPTVFPKRDDLDLFASMTPAKEVGGDLYDFTIDNDELFFIIGDVAGKGVPASLYMAVTRTLFRNLAGNYQSAANIVREMNHAIASANESFVFVTVFVGVLDLKTHHLTYCNAAHNAPVLITEQGTCSLLDAETNLPIGVEDHYLYEEQRISFPEGSALLLYTDGLTEATYYSKDGTRRLFGEDRLLHDVEKNSKASAIEVIDFLKQHVNVFADGTEQSDDLTMMFLRHGTSADSSTTPMRRLIMKNEMTEVSRMRGFFFSVCREYGIDDETAKSLNLAIEEWVANVINYAYPKGLRGHVEVRAGVSNQVLTVVIKDHGIPFDPTQHADVDIDAELDDRQIGGLGIFLVRNIMDTMDYERTADGYNMLTLTKRIENTKTQ
ncbi:MAG: SpoIIE family protein phosphatase [Prevotella sp.]|nr:SpoIIE family protein phosphatase [Prevotella sp.]